MSSQRASSNAISNALKCIHAPMFILVLVHIVLKLRFKENDRYFDINNTGYQIFLGRQWGRGRFHPRLSPLPASLHSAGILSGLRSPNEPPQTFWPLCCTVKL